MFSKILKNKGLFYSLLSALLYSLSVPIIKIYLIAVPEHIVMSLMYVGGGAGLLIFSLLFSNESEENKLKKGEAPYIVAMILCNIGAALCMLEAIRTVNASTVSLLSVLENSFTALVAFIFFKEKISPKLLIAIGVMIVASFLLSIDDISSFSLSIGSLFVFSACFLWGVENNLTSKISKKEPVKFVSLKCIAVSAFALILALINGEVLYSFSSMFALPVLGFFCYGLGIYYFAKGTRYYGASRTSTIFSLSPIIGSVLCIILFDYQITTIFFISFVLMLLGVVLASES